ncbi:Ferric enterobactin transport ATP-binding protein FepC [Fusobacterium sp. DD29]|uniref:ABC transporter ATP-binding protein n=1 Tax=unclassified Fusobacterium TaxID=2648384 RepID=UPI001B8D303D|nr:MULTISPECIES: ABC transporter ATP-binding protein [unclassified Fusobacterium]MBR8700534.1 Ferric enterobactin transport ATP-binding protein FepC [Fusobacterium sp. DD45]MBR8710283.1 Ferric enterobactin transport ATP-binding protein FepC [Fusobacterium sp. DD28]MBR8749573.1 Ferric enterobactin transport ATP-binding protein FepC [Fusobacterium sp. DD29]MBR8750831.1 Ferric enterobactin transport ATP-binding protein FepC [Fusobacterium sp. DD26]MBR8761839.1 Ferric enterobactin transport ATP-bi
MREKRLEVRDISFERNGKKILKNISFDMYSEEIVGVIGPNGSGKTTLLKTLNNINEKNSGTIKVKGKDISEFEDKELARNISFMNQNTNIGFDFPCIDVVVLGRYPYLDKFQEYSKKDMEIARKYMELTNTLKFEDKSILSLSGGERQRVLFAKTLTQEAQIVLLDEPTASLDMKYEDEIFRILQGVKEEGKSIIAIIHNLRTAIKYCDRLILLSEGEIIQCGTPEEVITEENLKKIYNIDVRVYKNSINNRLDFCTL